MLQVRRHDAPSSAARELHEVPSPVISFSAPSQIGVKALPHHKNIHPAMTPSSSASVAGNAFGLAPPHFLAAMSDSEYSVVTTTTKRGRDDADDLDSSEDSTGTGAAHQASQNPIVPGLDRTAFAAGRVLDASERGFGAHKRFDLQPGAAPKKSRVNNYVAPRQIPTTFVSTVASLVGGNVPIHRNGSTFGSSVGEIGKPPPLRRQLSGGQVEQFLSFNRPNSFPSQHGASSTATSDHLPSNPIAASMPQFPWQSQQQQQHFHQGVPVPPRQHNAQSPLNSAERQSQPVHSGWAHRNQPQRQPWVVQNAPVRAHDATNMDVEGSSVDFNPNRPRSMSF
jgi:hypothetical protein